MMIAMKQVIITNNPLVENEYKSSNYVEFTDTDLLGVLLHVRDMIHKGYKLMTHPLTGSIKPNESPYKTIILKQTKETEIQPKTDLQSVKIIEDSITTVKKFPVKKLLAEYINDMQIVDLEHIKAAMADCH